MTLAELGIVVRQNGPEEQRVPCFRCAKNERDYTLGINASTGVFHCFRCGWSGRAGVGESRRSRPIERLDDPAVAERKRERLRATIRETVALDHAKARAVRRYLESRALGEVLRNPPSVLRAHDGLECWDGTRSLGRYPAMIALFHNAAGKIATLHVTFLRQDGCAKASVPASRKILGVPEPGATRGGAIRLYAARGATLGVGEGIESALSLHLIRKIPTWATYCADNMARVRVPSGLRELQIGVDVDGNGRGQEVAEALAKRVMRWSPCTRVLYVKPELDGPTGDLNDELLRGRRVS